MSKGYQNNIHEIILEDALAGYWDWDIPAGVIYFSPAFKNMLGYSDVEFPNAADYWRSIIHPLDLIEVRNRLAKHTAGKTKKYSQELRYKRKDGDWQWILCTGRIIERDGDKPTRMVGCHLDISEQKQIEEELRQSQKRFEGAFKHSAIGMAIISLKGDWLKVNERICKIVGYTEEELLTKTFQDITHPDDLDADLNHVKELIDSKRESYQMEKRYFHKDGHTVWVLLSVSLVRDLAGKPLYFISQIDDISFRKKAEYKLDKAFKELEAHNLRLLDFAYIVSHNLRSHSTNLDMLLEFRKKVDNPSDKEILDTQLEEISHKLNDAVYHLNDVVQIQLKRNENQQELNLYEYAQKAIQHFKNHISELKAEVVNQIPKKATVVFHPDYLDSVLQNLISNALRYSHPERKPYISLTYTNGSETQKLSVTDNGLGIDLNRFSKKLFGMYKTFHRHKEARGIGLFLTKNQVEAQGGKIIVESIPEEGSTFTIEFQ
jgi:PAS domain S-box-containing protein